MSKKTKGDVNPGDLPEKLDLRSLDIAAERRAELLRLFPEVHTEGGKIDFERLRAALGEAIDTGRERYGLTWPGKAACAKTIQAPSMGTLLPVPGESVNFDTTENLIIEGDNLEVLKLLQKSYLGQVKMIYIDPPYNTGNDFIYPDNFGENLKTYLQYTGQVDAEGRRFGSNTEADGRFHSKWLNMMYPRLFLARNLLREDGVILCSIGDAEVENARRTFSEVFGEENFVACLVWEKSRKNDAKYFSIGHEYLLVYARALDELKAQKILWREEKPGAKEIWDEYLRLRQRHGKNDQAIEGDLQNWFSGLTKAHPSKKWARYKRIDANGPWRDRDISWPGGDGPDYDVLHPRTGKPCKVPEAGWRYASPEEMQRQIKLGFVAFRDDHTEPPFRKAHIKPVPEELEDIDASDEEAEDSSDEEMATQVRGSYFYKQSQVAVKYLRKLMGSKLFDNPKDHDELARLFKYVTGPESNAIIFDFFGGSGTSAEAVLQLNAATGSQHQFILCQLPEPSNPKEKTGKAALKAGLATIADITKERVRRVIKKLDAEDAGKLDPDGKGKQDRGFRVFKLAESNLLGWDGSASKDASALEKQLEMHIDHLRQGRTDQDLLYELLLKSGYKLTDKVVAKTLAGKTVYDIADGGLMICLDRALTLDLIRAMADEKPTNVVCLDAGFDKNDQLKANAVLTFKSKGVTSFRTV